jgi:hypothetical protein
MAEESGYVNVTIHMNGSKEFTGWITKADKKSIEDAMSSGNPKVLNYIGMWANDPDGEGGGGNKRTLTLRTAAINALEEL